MLGESKSRPFQPGRRWITGNWLVSMNSILPILSRGPARPAGGAIAGTKCYIIRHVRRPYDQTRIPRCKHRDRFGSGEREHRLCATSVGRDSTGSVADGENNEAFQEPARISQWNRRNVRGALDRRAKADGRASRRLSPARTKISHRKCLACRLEWQAAEDGDHSL